MGNPETVQRLKELHRKNAHDIIFLMKTKNNLDAIARTLDWLNIEKHHEVPPHNPGGGGLLLIWKSDIDVFVLVSTNNYVETIINYQGNIFQTTFVYGEPDHTKRYAIWNEISNLHPSNGGTWFLTGDFNEIIDNSEKNGGIVRPEGTFYAFRTFLSQDDLSDIKHFGNCLSWRGKRNSHLVQCRLDRAMCNSEWPDLFPSCRSQYLKYEASDHRPLISFLDTSRRKGTNIFIFDRSLRNNPEVQKLVKDTWNSAPQLHVEDKLALCKRAICRWNKAFYENSRKTLELLKTLLDEALTKAVPDEEMIFQLNSQLLQNYKREEEFWRQRSRQLWISLGDANTSYFHDNTKARQARNRLSVMEDENGIPWFEEEQISSVICNFYNKLFTSTNFDESKLVEDALKPFITQQMNENLTKEPTPAKIKEATFAIHPDKSSGPDGFSASLF